MPQDARRLAGTDEPIGIAALDDSDVLHPIAARHGLQSVAAAPLFVGQGATGALQVGSLQPREFTPEEVSLLSLLADRAALAVRHSRQYEHERGIVETLKQTLSLPATRAGVHNGGALPACRDRLACRRRLVHVIVLEEGRIAIAIGDVSGYRIRRRR